MAEDQVNRERAKRSAPDERRNFILMEACRQCIEEGRNAISLGDIARNLGISRSLVYHYFPNLESLMSALADYRIQEFLSTTHLPEKGTGEERLFSFFMDLSDRLAQAPAYVSGLIRTRQGREVLDRAVEDKIPRLIQIMKEGFEGPFSARDEELLHSFVFFFRELLARSSAASRSERATLVHAAVIAVFAAVNTARKEGKAK